ncbi:MAG: EF-hand domain-containing protein [Chthoniobacter sp.]|nr:EF-hand domain-containing protein [Chthoniobacter sp.]
MKSLTTIVAALALGSIAFAADEKPAPPPGAPHADGDKKPHGPGGDRPRMNPEDVFKKLDADSSGDVSLAEFKAGPRAQKDPAKAEEFYKKMDANNDGKLTLEEFKAGHHGGPGGDRKGPKPGGPGPDAPKPE